MNLKSILNITATCSFVLGIITAIIATGVATVGLITDYWVFDITEHKFWFLLMVVSIWFIIGATVNTLKKCLYPERDFY